MKAEQAKEVKTDNEQYIQKCKAEAYDILAQIEIRQIEINQLRDQLNAKNLQISEAIKAHNVENTPTQTGE